MRKPRVKITDEIRDRVISFYKNGKTIGCISDRLGLGYRTVSKILHRENVSVPRGHRSKDPDHLQVSSDLPIEERRRRRSENLRRWARNNPNKMAEYNRAYRARNPEKSRERTNKWHRENPNKRLKWKIKNKERLKTLRREWHARNRKQMAAAYKKYNQSEKGKATIRARMERNRSDPQKRLRRLLNGIRGRCEIRGMVFEEALYDMTAPTHCSCCGNALDYAPVTSRSRARRVPSFDRLVPTDGYTKDNVRIICMRCNGVKSDASVEEIRLIAAYMERHR